MDPALSFLNSSSPFACVILGLILLYGSTVARKKLGSINAAAAKDAHSGGPA